jgi:hypothetical protein
MMQLTDQIPGLSAAIEHEQLVRNAAFLSLSESLCGFDVNPLTLRHVLTLESIGSPFVTGGRPLPHDLAAFLLIIKPATGWARWQMLRRLSQLPAASVTSAIAEFIGEAFQDSPGGTGVESISYYSFGARIVDELARSYGWREAEILDMPLKRVFQYLKVIAHRNGNAPLFNPSDKVRGQWLLEVNRN